MRNPPKIGHFLFHSLLLIFFVFGGISFPVEFPSVEPLVAFEKKSQNAQELFEDSLRLSRCEEGGVSWKNSAERFASLCVRVSSADFMSLPEAERGERILNLLYENTLLKYSEKQSDIHTLFENGTYNCVSSSVLYALLSRVSGLDVRPQRTARHAFCTLYTSDGQKIDIETTNPNGFDPGKRKQVSSGKYLVVPKKNYAGRTETDTEFLISLIARNDVVQLEEKNDFARSVPLAAARLSFVEKNSPQNLEIARTEFFVAAHNFLAFLDRRSEFVSACRWCGIVGERYGTEPVQRDLEASLYNAVVDFLNKNRTAESRNLLSQYSGLISENSLESLESMIFMKETEISVRTKSPRDALGILEETSKSPVAKNPAYASQIESWKEYCWLNLIIETEKEGGPLKAAEVALQAQSALPKSQRVKNARNQELRNFDVEVHNRFVELANRKDYDSARKALEEGLSVRPESQMLKKDLANLKRISEKR